MGLLSAKSSSSLVGPADLGYPPPEKVEVIMLLSCTGLKSVHKWFCVEDTALLGYPGLCEEGLIVRKDPPRRASALFINGRKAAKQPAVMPMPTSTVVQMATLVVFHKNSPL